MTPERLRAYYVHLAAHFNDSYSAPPGSSPLPRRVWFFFFFFPSLQSQDQHNACVSGSFSVPDLAPGYKINRRLLPWCKMPVLK